MSTFFIQQFGCRATQADGAAIERQLLDRGCTPAAVPNDADVVVLNTCTVTAAADAQARDAIRKIHEQSPATRILVTGCYAQRAPEEVAALPGVALVVGNSHKPQIPDLLAPLFSTPGVSSDFIPADVLRRQLSPCASTLGAGLVYPEPRRAPPAVHGNAITANFATPATPAPIVIGDVFDYHHVLVAPVLGGENNHTRPTLKIQDGCNNRCSFCVIPFVRGKSRSLPSQTVIAEIRKLTSAGYKEIVLSGINLGAWGRDLSPRAEFLALLKQILDETGVARLRLSSIEPLDVTRDMVVLFASTDRLAEHFHMPLQSGSDRILAAMHRWYRSEHYARRIDLIQEQLPNAAIGGDVITGFPGETEEEHAATMQFIEARPFTYLHVFSYSVRPGTRAAALSGHVAPNVTKRRARELRALSEQKSAAFFRSQFGRTLCALTLRHSNLDDSSDWTPALSSNYLKLRLPGQIPPNEFVHAVCPLHSDSLCDLSSAGFALAAV